MPNHSFTPYQVAELKKVNPLLTQDHLNQLHAVAPNFDWGTFLSTVLPILIKILFPSLPAA